MNWFRSNHHKLDRLQWRLDLDSAHFWATTNSNERKLLLQLFKKLFYESLKLLWSTLPYTETERCLRRSNCRLAWPCRANQEAWKLKCCSTFFDWTFRHHSLPTLQNIMHISILNTHSGQKSNLVKELGKESRFWFQEIILIIFEYIGSTLKRWDY